MVRGVRGGACVAARVDACERVGGEGDAGGRGGVPSGAVDGVDRLGRCIELVEGDLALAELVPERRLHYAAERGKLQQRRRHRAMMPMVHGAMTLFAMRDDGARAYAALAMQVLAAHCGGAGDGGARMGGARTGDVERTHSETCAPIQRAPQRKLREREKEREKERKRERERERKREKERKRERERERRCWLRSQHTATVGVVFIAAVLHPIDQLCAVAGSPIALHQPCIDLIVASPRSTASSPRPPARHRHASTPSTALGQRRRRRGSSPTRRRAPRTRARERVHSDAPHTAHAQQRQRASRPASQRWCADPRRWSVP